LKNRKNLKNIIKTAKLASRPIKNLGGLSWWVNSPLSGAKLEFTKKKKEIMYQLQVYGFEDRFPRTVAMDESLGKLKQYSSLLEEVFFQMGIDIQISISQTISVDNDIRF
jgi:hypothetical protein